MRLPLIVGLLALIIVAIVFINEREESHPDSDLPDQTPTEQPEPTRTPMTSIDAGEDEDPRDVLVDLMKVQDESEVELVYRQLPIRFQVINYQEDWVRSLVPSGPVGDFESADEFEIEEYDGYRIVRSRENWLARWVFVVEDGEWRYDPGDRRLLIAAAQYRHGSESGFHYGMAPPNDYQARSRSEPDDEMISPLIRGRLEGVGVHEEGVDVSMVWELEPGQLGPDQPLIESHALSDTVIPLDGVSWRAGDHSGEVEVRWTDAGLVNRELRLHGWPDESMTEAAVAEFGTYAMLRYGLTVRLVGAPSDAGDITLEFEDVIVGPFGDDNPVPGNETISYNWVFTFPPETTDPVMVGVPPEPPESDDPIARSGYLSIP